MDSNNQEIQPESMTEEKFEKVIIENVQKHWQFLIIEGVIFWVLGLFAITMPLATGIGFEMLLGILFTIGGVFGVFRAFAAKSLPGRWCAVLGSVLFAFCGILLLANPMEGVITITLFLGVFFAVEGMTKLIQGVMMKSQKNGAWIFLDGILSLFVSAIIWSEWPHSAMWFLGLVVGIKMLVIGMSLFMLGMGARSARDQSLA